MTTTKKEREQENFVQIQKIPYLRSTHDVIGLINLYPVTYADTFMEGLINCTENSILELLKIRHLWIYSYSFLGFRALE